MIQFVLPVTSLCILVRDPFDSVGLDEGVVVDEFYACTGMGATFKTTINSPVIDLYFKSYVS
jgi:hypothetical protein